MITKKKSNGRQQTSKSKANKEYFNCGNKRYYAKDCYLNLKKKLENEKATEKAKRAYQKRN